MNLLKELRNLAVHFIANDDGAQNRHFRFSSVSVVEMETRSILGLSIIRI